MSKNNTTYYVIIIVCLFLMFFGNLIPAFAPEITPLGMQIICIFLGVVILWSTVGGSIWPGIFGIIALGLTNYTNVTKAITTAFGQSTLWVVMMGMVLANAIAQSGACESIARWFLSRKFIQGKPYIFTFIFLLTMRIIAAVSNPLGTMLIGFALLKGVAEVLGRDVSEKYFKCMVIFTEIACMNGDLMFPFKTWLTSLWMALSNILGESPNYLQYAVLMFFFGLLMEGVMIILLKILRIDVSFLEKFDNTSMIGNTNKLNSKQKTLLFGMLAAIAVGLIITILPQDSAIYPLAKNFGMPGAFGTVVAILCLLKDKEGKPILDFKKAMAVGNYWGSFFIIATAIPLATAMCSEETGITTWIGSIIGSAFANTSIIGIYAFILVVTIVLTNIASNVGIGMLMLPIAIPLAAAAGANTLVAGVCCMICCCYGILTPGGGASAAMIFGDKDNLKLKVTDIFVYGSVYLVAVIILGCIIFPIADKLI